MTITAYEVLITKGKFKGTRGFCFQRYATSCSSAYPKISVYDRLGNEYWVNESEVKTLDSFEFEYDEKAAKVKVEKDQRKAYKFTTIGALKEAIKDVPDDTKIEIYNSGFTGLINEDEVLLEIFNFVGYGHSAFINIPAEANPGFKPDELDLGEGEE